MIKHYLYVPWSKAKLFTVAGIPAILLVILSILFQAFPEDDITSLAWDVMLLLITFSVTISALAIYGRYQFWVTIGADDVAFKLPGFTNVVTLKRGDIREVRWDGDKIVITSDTPYGPKTMPYAVPSIPHDQREILVQYLRGAVDENGKIIPLFNRAHFGGLPDVESWGLRRLLHAYPTTFPGMFALAAARRNDQLLPFLIPIAPVIAIGQSTQWPMHASIQFAVFLGLLALLMVSISRNNHLANAEAFIAFGREGDDGADDRNRVQTSDREPNDTITARLDTPDVHGHAATDKPVETESVVQNPPNVDKSHQIESATANPSTSVLAMVWRLPDSSTLHSVSCKAIGKIEYSLSAVVLHLQGRKPLTIPFGGMSYNGTQRLKDLLAEQMPSLHHPYNESFSKL